MNDTLLCYRINHENHKILKHDSFISLAMQYVVTGVTREVPQNQAELIFRLDIVASTVLEVADTSGSAYQKWKIKDRARVLVNVGLTESAYCVSIVIKTSQSLSWPATWHKKKKEKTK